MNAIDFESLEDIIQKAKQIAREETIKRSRAILVQIPVPKHYHKSVHLDEDGQIISHYRWGEICEGLQDQMEFFVNSIPDQDSYLFRKGVQQDEREAAKYNKMAAELGCISSMSNYGTI